MVKGKKEILFTRPLVARRTARRNVNCLMLVGSSLVVPQTTSRKCGAPPRGARSWRAISRATLTARTTRPSGFFARPPSSQKPQTFAVKHSGSLLLLGLEMLSRYLDPLAGGRGGSLRDATRLGAPCVVLYLTTVLQVGASNRGCIRNEGELRTLAEALACPICWDLAWARAILMMRTRAVELASTSQDWSSAKFLELIPQPNVSTLTEVERESIARQKLRDAKLSRYLSGPQQDRRS